jgi:hypothetical protein
MQLLWAMRPDNKCVFNIAELPPSSGSKIIQARHQCTAYSFLVRLNFDPEDVIDTFIRNVGSHGLKNKQTPWPLIRERTIPTDRPPLVDEI